MVARIGWVTGLVLAAVAASSGSAGASRLTTVRNPRAARTDPLAARPVRGLTPGSLVCPLFAVPR
jgi:hypothetical protein